MRRRILLGEEDLVSDGRERSLIAGDSFGGLTVIHQSGCGGGRGGGVILERDLRQQLCCLLIVLR